MKSQNVRLVDVVLLGPVLFALATKRARLTRGERAFLAITGGATILYNLHNYLQIKNEQS